MSSDSKTPKQPQGKPERPMTKEDAKRIQRANDKSGNDPDFKRRAQRAADRREAERKE